MIWLAGLPVIWWAAILIADAIQPGRNLFELMEVLTEKLNHPFQLHYTEYTIKSVLVCTLLYAAGIGIFYSSQKNYRRGEEHGSARWGDARQICKKYSQKPYSQNILLTQNFRISLDTHEHRRCLNILVVGGSGAGKSRGFALPNIMQCCCSMVITDPKAELLRKTGGLLEKKGYEVRVFDLINPDTSFCYNPFEYVHDDKDVLRLISNLIQNTTPKGSQSSDPFWEKSETALLQALMLYLLHEAPPEEQNFAMIMEMLGSAQVKEEDEDYESPLDILFDRLEMRDPDSIAVKQYHIYKQAAGKTAKSILISVGVRLAAFNLPQIAKLTNTDELDLSSMGERKVALFCCIPDADTSLNYLVGMIYSQLFQTRNLPDIGGFINETAHMDWKPAAIHIVRFFAEQIEKLGITHGDQKVKAIVRITHDEEQGSFPVSQSVQLQLIISRDLTQLCNVEHGKASAAGNQNRFGCFSRDEKSRTFSSNSKRSHILRTSSRSIRLILSSIVSFAVSLKWTRTI